MFPLSFFLSKTTHTVTLFVALVFMFAGTPANAADVACGSCTGASEGAGKCTTFIQKCTDMGGMVDETDACIVAENKCGQNKCPGDLVRQGKECVMTATGGGAGGAPPVPGTSTQPPTGYPTTCYEGYGAPSAASEQHCTSLPGRIVKDAIKYTCYTANFNTCKVFKAGSTSGPTTTTTGGGNAPATTTTGGGNAPATTTTGSGSAGCSGSTLCNPLKVDSIEELVLTIIKVVLVFLLPVIVLYIMYAGYLFVTAQGNPGELTAAKKALLTALIGGVIILGAHAILDVVKGTIEAVTGESISLDTTPVPKSGGSGTTGSGSGGSGSGGTETNTSWNTTLDGIRAHLNIPAQHGLPGGKGAATKICGICYGESKTGDDRTGTAMSANGEPWANTCTND